MRWIVPNEAIYAQTRRQLTDRQHPYRQMLDVLSGNAVRFLETTDQLDARDVESHLCVMLLMLQAGSRENKDPLKMFRDRATCMGSSRRKVSNKPTRRRLRRHATSTFTIWPGQATHGRK